jgi:hypothetical protein
MFNCCDDIAEVFNPKEGWDIRTDAREIRNEIGAGWLYKLAKTKVKWNRRFFTLTNTKLIYYTEVDRQTIKGNIVIAGATAHISNARSSRDKKYFTITHPQCGTREFYAPTNNQRHQWIEAINNLSKTLKPVAVYGNLKKMGGLVRTSWQDRWCICVGDNLEYFIHASDNLAKGTIGN